MYIIKTNLLEKTNPQTQMIIKTSKQYSIKEEFIGSKFYAIIRQLLNTAWYILLHRTGAEAS